VLFEYKMKARKKGLGLKQQVEIFLSIRMCSNSRIYVMITQ
jgi:hypothetical protein